MHDDRCAQFFSKLRTFIHFFWSWRGYIQVVTFTFSGFTLSLLASFHHEFETITPTHKRLTVNVFIVLGQIQTTAQAFVYSTAIVFGRQTQFRFNGTTEQCAAIFVQTIAFHLNTGWRSAAGFDVSNREANILQTQCTKCFKTKHVSYQRGQHINHGAFFKKIDRVSYESVETSVIARHVFNLVSTSFVVVQIG